MYIHIWVNNGRCLKTKGYFASRYIFNQRYNSSANSIDWLMNGA